MEGSRPKPVYCRQGVAGHSEGESLREEHCWATPADPRPGGSSSFIEECFTEGPPFAGIHSVKFGGVPPIRRIWFSIWAELCLNLVELVSAILVHSPVALS